MDKKNAISDLWLAQEAIRDYLERDRNGESIDAIEALNEIDTFISGALRNLDETSAED